MNRFNLTFSGEIVGGQDLELVKLRFANKFAIDDPIRLERFFSGETVVLRRNLERKDAAQVYHELQLLGLVAALVKVDTGDAAEGSSQPSSPAEPAGDKPGAARRRAANGTLRLPRKAAPSTRTVTTVQKKRAKSATATATVAAGTSAHWPEDSADIAAEIKARKQTTQRLAAEKVAQEKAVLEAQQREAAAAAAHEQALAAERQRLAEAELARQAAEQARLAAAEAARKAAEQAEIKRAEAEEAAKKKALKAAAKRKAAEEAAQQKARRNREKAEKARRKAEEALRQQAELAEKKRLAAEESARRAAAVAAEDARLKTELDAIKQHEAEEAARLQAELAEKARQSAEQAAHIKAEAQRQQEEAQRNSAERRRIAAEELAASAAQLNSVDNASTRAHAAPVATAEPLRLRSAKPVKSRVKTVLEVPLRTRGETPQIGVPGQRKRQSGEPNLYTLRPFRNSETVRTRAAQAGQLMRKAYTSGVIALAALLIAGGSYLQNADDPVVTGASAIAINANSEPLLLAGDALLLHDRAGVSTTEVALDTLGVRVLEPPLVFDNHDVLFARGQLLEPGTESAATGSLQLLRCELARSTCAPFSPQLQDINIDAFVINPLDDSVLVADRNAGQLLKIDSAGAIVASAAVTLPTEPVLRLHGGLLLMNSAEGPAISVFRYEEKAFGRQLDEILLPPANAQALAEARVGDFVWSGDSWWVNLRNPATGAGELHRFDEEWNYLDTVTLASAASSVQLVNWGQRTLVNDPRHAAIQRYNAQGQVEAPFASTLLQERVDGQQQRARLAKASWHGGLLLCALTALLACVCGYWQGLRNLVYRPRREQGAEPLDDHAAGLQWIEPAQTRQAQLRRTGIHYGLGVFAALALAIALNVSAVQMVALLLVFSGPAIALLLLARQAVGYIGVLGDRLLLVDHSGLYHLASGSRLQYHGPFLVIDDIVVFSGSHLLPAFSPAPLQRYVSPLALGGVKVDRRTIAVKLLECRHPLALGAVATVATVATATLLLLLPTLF